MFKYLLPFVIVAGLAILSVEAMDKEWLNNYQAQTGNSARFAESDDQCNSVEYFDARFGICVKMREFTVSDNLQNGGIMKLKFILAVERVHFNPEDYAIINVEINY